MDKIEEVKKIQLTLTWCRKHKNWWVTNCPDCMVDDNEESIKQQGRREVVEWMIKQGYFLPDHMEDGSVIQVQLKIWFKDNPELLKEWGIKL